MVTSKNAKQYAVGAVGEMVRQDGDRVRATLTVFDATTIEKMERGKVQISCGYDVYLEETPGVVNGQKYDAIQRNIRGNHVAIVDTGRAGPEIHVRLDDDKPFSMVGFQSMDELKEIQAKLDASNAAQAALRSELETLKGKLDAAKDRADRAEASLAGERKDAIANLGEKVKARVALEKQAGAILGELDVSKLDERAIQVAVIEKVSGKKVAEDKSSEYVAARFDAALEVADQGTEALAKVAELANGPRGDNADSDAKVEAAKKKMIEDSTNAWKRKE
jgi:hypothetical protein